VLGAAVDVVGNGRVGDALGRVEQPQPEARLEMHAHADAAASAAIEPDEFLHNLYCNQE